MPYSSKNKKRKIYDQNHPINKDKKMFDQEKSYSSKKVISTEEDDLVFLKKENKKNISKNNYKKNTTIKANNLNKNNINNVSTSKKTTINNYKNNQATLVQDEPKTYKKVVVKKRLKIKNIVILFLLIAIISLIPIYLWAINKNDDNSNNSYVENSNNESNTSEDTNNLPNDVVIEKDEWELLKERINFYKEDYSERYINYRNNNPDLDLEKVVVYVNIGLDKEFYTNINSSPKQNSNLVLTNKFYSLDSKYVPKDLEVINSKYSSGERLMTHDARIAFEKMARDASLEGLSIRAVSTYRSYSYQKKLYTNYVNSDGVKKADTYSARAGHSEHQTGLAVDVDNRRLSYTDFGKSKEFKWMLENAHKYGFILRYTDDFEFITGYKNEPWHYRYVGEDIATYIYNNPMTYEEYFVRFLDK